MTKVPPLGAAHSALTDRALNSNQNQPRVQALLEYLAINNMLKWPSSE